WWRGRLRLVLGRRHVVSAVVAVGLCVAWIGAAVAQAGWEPFITTVKREAFQRIVPNYTPRPYPWGDVVTHPFRVLAAALPCSAVALLALRPGFANLWDERGRRLLQALHCWTWPNLVVWSLMTEHAAPQSFPLLTALARPAALVC